jgi:hypothetical protein
MTDRAEEQERLRIYLARHMDAAAAREDSHLKLALERCRLIALDGYWDAGRPVESSRFEFILEIVKEAIGEP